MPLYKLPLTITDDTGSINVIAFSYIAEDLVERSAYHASQNMKIDPTQKVVALENAIGKIRLFHIGMSTNSTSSFSINYVLRKSFPVDTSNSALQQSNPEATPTMLALTPPDSNNTGSQSSNAKRSLDFQNEIECSEAQHDDPSKNPPKRQSKIK